MFPPGRHDGSFLVNGAGETLTGDDVTVTDLARDISHWKDERARDPRAG